MWKLRASYQPIMSWRPRTWLLAEGWRRYGLVSIYEVPGPRASIFPGVSFASARALGSHRTRGAAASRAHQRR